MSGGDNVNVLELDGEGSFTTVQLLYTPLTATPQKRALASFTT